MSFWALMRLLERCTVWKALWRFFSEIQLRFWESFSKKLPPSFCLEYPRRYQLRFAVFLSNQTWRNICTDLNIPFPFTMRVRVEQSSGRLAKHTPKPLPSAYLNPATNNKQNWKRKREQTGAFPIVPSSTTDDSITLSEASSAPWNDCIFRARFFRITLRWRRQNENFFSLVDRLQIDSSDLLSSRRKS